jgi:hypothetical protein
VKHMPTIAATVWKYEEINISAPSQNQEQK